MLVDVRCWLFVVCCSLCVSVFCYVKFVVCVVLFVVECRSLLVDC